MKKVVIDFESSGLARGSYPLEVAWAEFNAPLTSYLIKPTPIWVSDSRLWDPAAECLHGLSLDHLFEHGEDVHKVAQALVSELRDARVYSNNPLYDQDWLHRLLSAGGCDQPLQVLDFSHLLSEVTDIEGINQAYKIANATMPPRHRAAQDVLHLWEIYRQCLSFDETMPRFA